MEEKCQVDDDSSPNNQISHGLTNSAVENKPSLQLQRDVDISTISSEKIQSSNQTSIRSDISSETGEESNKDIKDLVAKRAAEIHHRNSSIGVLKIESLSSPEESGEAVRLSSVDFADKRPRQSLNENSAQKSHFRQGKRGYFHPAPSYEFKNVHESEVVASSDHNLYHRKIDLYEGIRSNGAECLQRSLDKLNSSCHAVNVLEPISVVAKVGVPVGLPKKPLQFGGELGWRRSGTTSAFRPTFLGDSERRSLVGSGRSLFSQGIDLNVAPTMDLDFPTDETYVDNSSNQPEKCLLDLNCQSGNYVNHHKHGVSAFHSNENHVIENTCKTINPQLTQNCLAFDAPTCSGGSGRKPIFESRRSSYWIDSNSMRGFCHGQAQPLLVAAPAAEQVRMMVPIQSEIAFFPHAPSGLYISKINGLSPTFYPRSFLSHFNSHHGTAVVPQMSGPVLAPYPGTLNVLESSQGLHPNTFANIRPRFIQNGNIALLENGSRGAQNIELLVPTRNALLEDRLKPVEQLAVPAFSTKRREPDGGWDSCPINYRRIAP